MALTQVGMDIWLRGDCPLLPSFLHYPPSFLFLWSWIIMSIVFSIVPAFFFLSILITYFFISPFLSHYCSIPPLPSQLFHYNSISCFLTAPENDIYQTSRVLASGVLTDPGRGLGTGPVQRPHLCDASLYSLQDPSNTFFTSPIWYWHTADTSTSPLKHGSEVSAMMAGISEGRSICLPNP